MDQISMDTEMKNAVIAADVEAQYDDKAKRFVEEKLNIIEAEYNIPVEDNMRKDVSVMCNLSQRILEKGIEEGIERGIEKGKAEVIITMYKSGYALEDIANIINKDEEEIKAIIQKEELTLV